MNYSEFIVAIKALVSELLPPNVCVQTRTALKNNDRERTGLCFDAPGTNLSPTIYLEEYFQRFQDVESLEEIASHIVSVYENVKYEHMLDTNTIKNFDTAKEKIVYKLVNAQMNETLLEKVPHLLFLDLAIVFYMLLDVDSSGSATILVTNELMELWNTNLSQISELASTNSPLLLPPVIKPMYEVIEELIGNICENDDCHENLMFVLTNPIRNYGSICIIYEGVLKNFASQLGESFYLLPSSIHEMILVPESKSPSKEMLAEMVEEINQTQLTVEEILSNRVYYYDFNRDILI